MARNFNPKYKINLVDVFNRAYADRSIQFRSKLRPFLREREFRDAYSNRVIDNIIDRSLDGIDKNNKPFATYTEAYKKSLKFKAFGKSSSVNLRLTGDMLSDLKSSAGFNDVTFNLGTQNNKNKARGHITGGEGKWNKSGALKKRDFLGLPKKVEEQIMVETLQDIRAESLVLQADLFDFAATLGILENLGVAQ